MCLLPEQKKERLSEGENFRHGDAPIRQEGWLVRIHVKQLCQEALMPDYRLAKQYRKFFN